MDDNESIVAPGPEVAAPKVVKARKPKAAKRREAKVAKTGKKPARAKKGTKPIVAERGILQLRKKYNKGESNAGNISYDSGDAIAQELRGMALEDVYDLVARKSGETERMLKAKYGKLNPGMQRMNLGNRLRKLVRDKANGKKLKKAA